MLPALLLLGSLSLAQPEATGEPSRLDVRRLVTQLNAPQLADREQAEQKLLAIGPKALELLPPATDRLPAEVQQRLARVRQKLQQGAAEAAAQPARITLRGEMPLSKVLAALQQQSGNTIVDFRKQFGHEQNDPLLKVELDQVPFWQALDRVLDQAQLTVYGFGEKGAIDLVGRAKTELSRTVLSSYSGAFRFEPIRVLAQRDLLDPQAQSLKVIVGVTWEPRLHPIMLKQRMANVHAVDEKGQPLAVDDRQADLEFLAGERAATELTLPFALPPRNVQEIASLKGKLSALMPGKTESFRFSDPAKVTNVQSRIAGVTVTLEQVRKNNETWEVRLRVRFDEPGQSLESHRGWIYKNEAYLESPDGKTIPYDSLETTRRTEDEVGIAYFFVLSGPIDKHVFVYKTPVAILAIDFDYELKAIKLP